MTYAQTRWSLNALLSDRDPATFDKALAAFEKKVRKAEAWRKTLKASIAAKDFAALIKDYEAVTVEGYRLYAFAQLWFSEDTQSQQAMALLGRVQQTFAQAQNRLLYISLWWKGLDEKNATRLLKTAGDVRYWLEAMRAFKPYTLSEPEEKVINLKDVNGASAMQTLYDTITNRFTFNLEIEGETKKLNREQLMAYVRNSNPEVRAAAYRELYRVYGDSALVLSQIYAALVRDWRSEQVDLRGYKSPMAVRNLGNDLPDKVVDTLLKVIAKNSTVFQRYFKLKAKWLGVDKLRRYDIYAPLAPSEKQVPYGEAVDMVLDTFTAFSPRIGALAKQVFEDNHVDAEVRHGKRGGAFCYSVRPGLSPFVLLNYMGRPRDVAVIAHEMGHAIHALMAAHHSILTFHSSLPMAETASVFAEILLTEKLLAQETDPAAKRDILAGALDDIYATVGRQGYFALWEKEAHELVNKGETTDAIAARYHEALKAQFGDAVEMNDDFKWEWVSIPHFYHTPFYVYAYAFGQLLVLALYQMYKREGEAFVPKYEKILAHGGAEAPMTVLQEAKINIASEKFWQGGFDVISGMIDELEKLS